MGKQESTTTTTFAKGKTNPLLPEVPLRKKTPQKNNLKNQGKGKNPC